MHINEASTSEYITNTNNYRNNKSINFINHLVMTLSVNNQCLQNVNSMTVSNGIYDCGACRYRIFSNLDQQNNTNNGVIPTIACIGCRINYCIDCLTLKISSSKQMICGLCAGNKQINLVQFVEAAPDPIITTNIKT